MTLKSFRRAFQRWLDAVVFGIVGNVFGWGGFAATLAIGFLSKTSILGASDNRQWWVDPLLNALMAFLTVSTLHLFFIAPYRAWRITRPFRIKINAGSIETTYPQHKFEPQRAIISVKNRAYKAQSGCLFHVMDVAGFDNQHCALPRYIEEFSIDPGETKTITFATWTRREPPYSDGDAIVLSGPVGWGWGGNYVALPCPVERIVLRIAAPECEPRILQCRLWIKDRQLKITDLM